MHATPAAAQLYRMPKVKHLVVNEVFNRVAWDFGAIKHAAHHNCVVGRIIVSQALARVVSTPGHLRTRHQTVEMPPIQVLKDFFEMKVSALRATEAFAPAHLPDQMHSGGDCPAAGKTAVTRRMSLVDFLPI